MLHRVTQQSVARSALQTIRQASESLSTAQEQLATSRRINRLSDAPLDAARAHRARARRSRLELHLGTLEHAKSEIDFGASILQNVSDLFVEAREICTSAANATTDPATRESLAEAVDQLLEGLLQQANTQYDGRYIFAGGANDAPAYSVERTGEEITAAVYEGRHDYVELDVGPNTRVALGEPGTRAFGGTEAFDSLLELRDLLRNTDGLTEGEQGVALSAHIETLRESHNRVVDGIAAMGWRSTQLGFTRTTLEDAALADSAAISELEDADFAEATALLYRSETAMQTALIISARMMQNSLLSYLE